MSADVALQDGIFAALVASADVAELVGARVFDNAPPRVAYPYVTFGPSEVLNDDQELIASDHLVLQIDVWTQEAGAKRGAKLITAAIERVLSAPVELAAPYGLQLLRVVKTRVLGDPDEGVAHGVMTVEAWVQELP